MTTVRIAHVRNRAQRTPTSFFFQMRPPIFYCRFGFYVKFHEHFTPQPIFFVARNPLSARSKMRNRKVVSKCACTKYLSVTHDILVFFYAESRGDVSFLILLHFYQIIDEK